MQALIPFVAALSLVSGSQLNLVPYAYLASPFPVYHQAQNTRTGEHAYSYAGGPSAKEEIKDADGVVRGSYSYIDANSILQSVFYVADDNGFRVLATNLPGDDYPSLEPSHVILARSAKEDPAKSSRRKRSLPESPKETIAKEETSERIPDSPLLKVLAPEIPLATSHQSQVQIHRNAAIKSAGLSSLPILTVPTIPTELKGISGLTPLPTYHENRIELHKQLGIEGPNPQNAVKIGAAPLAIVQPTTLPLLLTKRIIPANQLDLTTSISSHGISQIHGASHLVKPELLLELNRKQPELLKESSLKEETGKEAEPSKDKVAVEGSLIAADPLRNLEVSATISSHGISQIHSVPQVASIVSPWIYGSDLIYPQHVLVA